MDVGSKQMKIATYILIALSLTAFIASSNVPVLELGLGESDDFGTSEEETCFGCGDCSVYCAIENEFSLLSSSSLKAQGKNTYSPKNIDDYNLQSAWIEGKAGLGIGEWVEYNFDQADFSKSDIELNGLYLFNGYRKNLDTWKQNSRITKMKMIVNGKDFAILNLHNSYKIQSTDFPALKLKNIKTIRFEILEAYKGDKFEDVALSELKLKGTHHH